MEKKKFDYYQVIIRKADQILEMLSLDDFVRYALAYQIKQVIKTKDFETGVPLFAFSTKGALYICPSQGYESLEDYQTALENKFPDAATFYAAREKNCSTYSEYETLLSNNITDTELFDKMKKAGFIEGYALFDSQRKQNELLPQLPSITNAKELHHYATEYLFEDFAQFKKLWEVGFTTVLEYQLAHEKGINNAAEYSLFKAGKFTKGDDYKKAKGLEIKTFEELKQYENLHAGDYPKSSFDELLLINILSKFEQHSKVTFDKLYDHFLKSEEKFRHDNCHGELKLPKWYTKRLRKESDVREFLTANDYVKLYGTFDADKDLFETISIKRRKVVVDGSNVAYNSNFADRKAGVFNADLNNILILVKKLKEEYHFEHVHVIADNNLIHKAKDKSVLSEIKTRCKFTESPPGVQADLYLIDQVKKQHCLLITNDTFKDWKLTDRWVDDNIDFYRIKFVLNGEVVMLPYMDRFEKK